MTDSLEELLLEGVADRLRAEHPYAGAEQIDAAAGLLCMMMSLDAEEWVNELLRAGSPTAQASREQDDEGTE
jgi:hypothetical protein